MADDPAPTLIALCGNADAGDDALGCVLGARLQADPPVGAEVLVLGQRPAALLDHLPGRAGLCIVDAIYWPGRAAGEVIELDWSEAEPGVLVNDDPLSSHGLSIGQQLRLAAALGLLPPRVGLIGLVVGEVGLGRGLSGPLRRRVDELLRRVERWCAPVGAGRAPHPGGPRDA